MTMLCGAVLSIVHPAPAARRIVATVLLPLIVRDVIVPLTLRSPPLMMLRFPPVPAVPPVLVVVTAPLSVSPPVPAAITMLPPVA